MFTDYKDETLKRTTTQWVLPYVISIPLNLKRKIISNLCKCKFAFTVNLHLQMFEIIFLTAYSHYVLKERIKKNHSVYAEG